jgi:pimeloyl-ACP methyl ester carboxylesterase
MRSELLNFTEAGAGLPVVLLHAFPLNRRMWGQELVLWSKTCRVIAPDWRGFGDAAVASDALTMESCADDVHQLLEQLAIKPKVILVGLSMGGYVAFEYVRKYADTLQGLVLVATQPISDSEASRKARFETAELVERDGTGPLADKLIPRLLGKTTLDAKPEVAEKVRGLVRSNSPHGVAAACYGLASRRDSSSLLRQIRVPSLIVAGEEDIIIPRAQADLMHREIASSQLAVITQSGHLINLEQPELFHDVVSGFLQQF